MNWTNLPTQPLGIALMGAIGLALVLFSLRAASLGRGVRSLSAGLHDDLDRLMGDISRSLRILTSPARAGGFLYREKQEEVGRLLAEMQSRLRLMDDPTRLKYEGRAGRVLNEAARVGITLPPP
jgi:hypothetical protein